MKKKPEKPPQTSTPEEFCVVWRNANSASEVADALGLTISAVTTRASFYRRQGVNIKKMTRGRPQLDVAALNAMLAELENGEKQP